MTRSASSLDRIPKLLSVLWEEHRIEWEDLLRVQVRVFQIWSAYFSLERLL